MSHFFDFIVLICMLSVLSIYVRYSGLQYFGKLDAGRGREHFLRIRSPANELSVSQLKDSVAVEDLQYFPQKIAGDTDEDDEEAWKQTLQSLSTFLGPYRNDDNTITELIIDPTSSGKLALLRRQCGYNSNSKDTKDLWEDCSSYPFFKDLLAIGRSQKAHFRELINSLEVQDLTMSNYSSSSWRTTQANKVDTLIALTISDQLPTTVRCVEALGRAARSARADIVIIDDHSIDGSVEYLRKRGFHVVTRDSSTGLSRSWNIAYEIAVKRGYTFMFVVNNDVIVEAATIREMRKVLPHTVVVSPMTTFRGAGNNLQQDVLRALRKGGNFSHSVVKNLRSFEAYTRNPRNAHSIQQQLSRHFPNGESLLLSDPVRFNGFFWGCSINAIHKFAYNHSAYLLIDEESHPMVGQETFLVDRMKVFHDKMLKETQMKLPGIDSCNQILPRLALGAFAYHFKSVTLQAGLNHYASTMNSSSCNIRDKNNRDIRDNYRLYHNIKSSGDNMRSVFRKDWPVLHDTAPSSLLSSIIIEPPLSNEASKLTMSIVVSDPVTNPGAGDLITAKELATALCELHPGQWNIQYLYQGSGWYKAEDLKKTDVLLVLLDKFDLSKALRTIYDDENVLESGSKRGLVSIAWARNWFHRWLGHSWIGHYDLILVSSFVASRIFTDISNKVGLQTTCIHSCPHPQPASQFVKPHARSGFRRDVSIDVMMLATNPELFNCRNFKEDEQGPSVNASNYLIPVSYHGQSRSIMNLSPDLILPFHGNVIGIGWDKAPLKSRCELGKEGCVTHEWLAMWKGYVPYSKLPEEYCKSTVVVDDANHVTRDWGSVNSRVWDALSCGRMVVTNGVTGSKEVFGGILPYWNDTTSNFTKNSMNLKNTLMQYFQPNDGASLKGAQKRLQPTEAYNTTVTTLQRFVRSKHTYMGRARELTTMIQDHGIKLNSNVTKDAPQESPRFNTQICLGVRTMPTQYQKVSNLLANLLNQHSAYVRNIKKGAINSSVDLRIVVIDTQNHAYEFRQELQNVVADANKHHGSHFARGHLLFDPILEVMHSNQKLEQCTPMGLKRAYLKEDENTPNSLYGYEESDTLLAYLIQQWGNRHAGGPLRCDWISFTNGDNSYNSAWFGTVASALRDQGTSCPVIPKKACESSRPNPLQIIAWDFTTHHLRNSSLGMIPNQFIRTDLDRRGYVDLASFMVNTELIVKSKAKFLPFGLFTEDLFARDFFFVKTLRRTLDKGDTVGKNGTLYLRQILLFHQ